MDGSQARRVGTGLMGRPKALGAGRGIVCSWLLGSRCSGSRVRLPLTHWAACCAAQVAIKCIEGVFNTTVDAKRTLREVRPSAPLPCTCVGSSLG